MHSSRLHGPRWLRSPPEFCFWLLTLSSPVLFAHPAHTMPAYTALSLLLHQLWPVCKHQHNRACCVISSVHHIPSRLACCVTVEAFTQSSCSSPLPPHCPGWLSWMYTCTVFNIRRMLPVTHALLSVGHCSTIVACSLVGAVDACIHGKSSS